MPSVNPEHLKPTLDALRRLIDEAQAKGAVFEPEAVPVLLGSIGHYAALPESAQNLGRLPAGAMEGLHMDLGPGQVITAAGILEWFRRYFPKPIVVQVVPMPDVNDPRDDIFIHGKLRGGDFGRGGYGGEFSGGNEGVGGLT